MNFYANAKINLYLEITGKRTDGYHNLETIFQEIDLYDELEFNVIKDDKIDLYVYGNFSVSPDTNNLVYRSLNIMKNYFKIDKGIEVGLKKNIPFGAGLGGGSSDAGSCIKFFKEYFDIKGRDDEFKKIALSLGADVPFFLLGGRCFAFGIGEELKKIEKYPKKNIVLVFPKINLETKKIYKIFSENYFNKNRDKSNSFCLTNNSKKSNLLKIDFFQNNDFLFNRLEEIAIQLAPEIKEIKDLLIKLGAENSLMSGSGSSVFGIVSSKDKADEIKEYIKNNTEYFSWSLSEI